MRVSFIDKFSFENMEVMAEAPTESEPIKVVMFGLSIRLSMLYISSSLLSKNYHVCSNPCDLS